MELHIQYDPSTLAFLPAVPGPSSAPISWKRMPDEGFHSSELEAQISDVLNTDHMKQWEEESIRRTIQRRVDS